MKRQKSCGPRLGKLVHQLPGVVTFSYDLRFRRMIVHWKGIVEEIHFGSSIMPLNIIQKIDPEKYSFRPSKWPRKWKLLKIVNCQNCQKTALSQLEKVGGHWYPYGSGTLLIFFCSTLDNRGEILLILAKSGLSEHPGVSYFIKEVFFVLSFLYF